MVDSNGEKPLVSVIVPVYQTQEYVEACFASIARQRLKEIEVVVVDDGSTDSSKEICDKYAAQDSRFRVFHCEHRGIAPTRSFGLEQANGEYIAWVDSDDSIDQGYLDAMYHAAVKFDADMVIARDDVPSANPCVILGGKILETQLNGKLGALWNTLISAKLYVGKVFQNYGANEDTIMLAQISAESRRAVAINSTGYHYRVREGSAVHTYDASTMISRLNAIERRNSFIEKHYPSFIRYTHYSSVLEATKVNRQLRTHEVQGDVAALRTTILHVIDSHLFRIPMFSLSKEQLREVISGFKLFLLRK